MSESIVSLSESPPGTVCFVKLYLFERDIMEPLTHYLKRESNMDLKPISSKCSGLTVLTPVHKTIKKVRSETEESLFYINECIVGQIYMLYREYIQNFGPNLNASQVLLYLYKQFFNIKNENFTSEYSVHITQLLANDIVLKYIQE